MPAGDATLGGRTAVVTEAFRAGSAGGAVITYGNACASDRRSCAVFDCLVFAEPGQHLVGQADHRREHVGRGTRRVEWRTADPRRDVLPLAPGRTGSRL